MPHPEPQQTAVTPADSPGQRSERSISDADIARELAAYLERYPDEATRLSGPMQMLSRGGRCTSRHDYPMHVTVGALLVRASTEILLVQHRAYGILLQPGGHLEPGDTTLIDAAMRELTEETGVDPAQIAPASPAPVYIAYGQVPARPAKGEPSHHHLDIGFAFTTQTAEVGHVQESEVTGAGWYRLAEAEELVGRRIRRAVVEPGPAAGSVAR